MDAVKIASMLTEVFGPAGMPLAVLAIVACLASYRLWLKLEKVMDLRVAEAQAQSQVLSDSILAIKELTHTVEALRQDLWRSKP